MSKKQTAQATEVKSIDTSDWQDETTPDLDGWYSPQEGEKPVIGRVVGAKSIPGLNDEPRPIVLVKLFEPHEAKLKGGESITLETGQVIAIQVRSKCDALLDYVAFRGAVYLRAIEKKSISRGRTIWQFEVKGKGRKGPRPSFDETTVLPSHDMPAGDMGDDDLPF